MEDDGWTGVTDSAPYGIRAATRWRPQLLAVARPPSVSGRTIRRTVPAIRAVAGGRGGCARVGLFLRDVLVIVVVAVLVVVPDQDVPGPLVLHPLRVDAEHAAGRRPHPRQRARSRADAAAARRRRRVQRSRAAGCSPSEPAQQPPVTAAVDWVLSLVGLSAPDSERPPDQARHRAAGRPRRLLQRARADERQRRPARRAVHQAAGRRHACQRDRLRRHGARRTPSG